jgi:hypothetical protein
MSPTTYNSPLCLQTIQIQLESISVPSKILLHLKSNSFYLRTHVTTHVGHNPSIKFFPFLLDCGATLSFCDNNFAHQQNLTHHPLPQILNLLLINGEHVSSGRVTHNTDIELTLENGIKFIQEFLTMQLNITHPFVLGYDWFRRMNPSINWQKPSICFKDKSPQIRRIQLYQSESAPTTQKVVCGAWIEDVEDEDELKYEQRHHEPDYDPIKPPILEDLRDLLDEEGDVESKHTELNHTQMDQTKQKIEEPVYDKSNLLPLERHMQLKCSKHAHPLFHKPNNRATSKESSLKASGEDNKKIRLIGAAPFAKYAEEGVTIYQLHTKPASKRDSESSEHV